MFNKKRVFAALVCILCFALTIIMSGCSNSTTLSTISTTTSQTTGNPSTLVQTTQEPTTEEPTTEEPTTEKSTQKPTQKSAKKSTQKSTKKPTQKPTEAPKNIEITNVSSSVSPGEYAYISMQGEPNTDYSITVIYNSGPSTAAGLYTKTSDSNGNVSWEWKVGTRTASGTYPIIISGGGKTYTTEFTVY